MEGTEREEVEAVLRAYIARPRKNRPRYEGIEDWMLPDMVMQRLREELDKMR